jgi:glycosyltransferase involved in cell wall biosynthesis
MRPLVSILIPAFNAEKWIADTLRSAGSQTWPRKEIIVVDDGSTDRTLAIARRFESPTLRVVSRAHQGSAAARNEAFSLSKGEYIQWLDADDLMAPDKIARQMEALEQCQSKRTLFTSAWTRFMYRHYRAEFVPTALWRDLSPTEWMLIKMGQRLYMPDSAWLVSRELTEAAGPWDTSLSVNLDGEYFSRVLLLSDAVRFVPGARVYYRDIGFNGLSYIGNSEKKLESRFRTLQMMIAYLRSLEDSERTRAACVTYLQNYLIYFYPEQDDTVRQMREMARELGGELAAPRLSWKYKWLKTLFGWDLAKRARLFFRRLRWRSKSCWDKAQFQLDGWIAASRVRMTSQGSIAESAEHAPGATQDLMPVMFLKMFLGSLRQAAGKLLHSWSSSSVGRHHVAWGVLQCVTWLAHFLWRQ